MATLIGSWANIAGVIEDKAAAVVGVTVPVAIAVASSEVATSDAGGGVVTSGSFVRLSIVDVGTVPD
jgi:hypothetical protein